MSVFNSLLLIHKSGHLFLKKVFEFHIVWEPYPREHSLVDPCSYFLSGFRSSVKSPVDGRSLEGIESIRIQNTTDFQGQNKIIRWTEVFFIENGGEGDSMSKRHVPEPVDLSRLAENLAIAFCLALSENLQDLNTLGLNKLGLRVTVDLEKVSVN